MNDFDKRFKKQSKEFDRDFARTKRTISALIFGSLVIGLGLVGFVIWIVIMLLRFFGVV